MTTIEIEAGEGQGGAVERPDYIDEKFWDAEAGAPRVEDLAKSYREVQSLVGRRVGDLSPDARRKLAESLPDEMRSTWAEEVKAQLAQDEEWLKPIREQWEAGLPRAPEQYDLDAIELPDGIVLDPESPMLAEAAEWAKGVGLPQERFGELLALGAKLLAPSPSLEERVAAFGADFRPRATAATNQALTAAGADAESKGAVQALLADIMSPEALRGLEILLAARGEKPMPDERGQGVAQAVTQETLESMVRDPRYWRDRDPAFVRQVDDGYRRLYPSPQAGDTI